MTGERETLAALATLDEMADEWSSEIDAPSYGRRLAEKADGLAEAIEAMMRQCFVEGAYRMFLQTPELYPGSENYNPPQPGVALDEDAIRADERRKVLGPLLSKASVKSAKGASIGGFRDNAPGAVRGNYWDGYGDAADEMADAIRALMDKDQQG